jgi:hypothetical protein
VSKQGGRRERERMGDRGSGSRGRGVIQVFFAINACINDPFQKFSETRRALYCNLKYPQSPGLRDRVGQGQRWNRYKVTKERKA